MTPPNEITRDELAALIGARSPSYINELEKNGRAIRAPDGKRWLKHESLAAYHAGRDPSKQGVADRWAAHRAATATPDAPTTPTSADTPGADDPATSSAPQPSAARPGADDIGSNYQKARAVKERYGALEAKRAYEVAIGTLRDAKEVEGVVAAAMTEIRLRLQNLAASIAPIIAAQTDEAQARATLTEAFDHALRSASQHFAQLSQQNKTAAP